MNAVASNGRGKQRDSHEMKMTPSTFCLHFVSLFFFSEQLGRQLFIQLDIQFYLIYDMFLWTLCGPCSSNFLCDRKGQAATEPSFPIVNVNITSLAREAAARVSLLVFVNVLFTTEAEMELIVKQSKAPTSFFFSFKKAFFLFCFRSFHRSSLHW